MSILNQNLPLPFKTSNCFNNSGVSEGRVGAFIELVSVVVVLELLLMVKLYHLVFSENLAVD